MATNAHLVLSRILDPAHQLLSLTSRYNFSGRKLLLKSKLQKNNNHKDVGKANYKGLLYMYCLSHCEQYCSESCQWTLMKFQIDTKLHQETIY